MSDPEAETRADQGEGRREDQTRTATGDRAPAVLGRIGPYRLLEVLGEGGRGVVYHAEQGPAEAAKHRAVAAAAK